MNRMELTGDAAVEADDKYREKYIELAFLFNDWCQCGRSGRCRWNSRRWGAPGAPVADSAHGHLKPIICLHFIRHLIVTRQKVGGQQQQQQQTVKNQRINIDQVTNGNHPMTNSFGRNLPIFDAFIRCTERPAKCRSESDANSIFLKIGKLNGKQQQTIKHQQIKPRIGQR